MWDVLITLGNLIIVPSLLPTVLHRGAYVPRTTSGATVAGLSVVFAGLIGAELFISSAAAAAIAFLWVIIFIFRGDPHRAAVARQEMAPEPVD